MFVSPRSAIPPPRRGVVDRPRLDAMLDGGIRGPLTLVAAPSGTGKTVLVSSWARRRGTVRWISVGEREDADALRREIHAAVDAALDPVLEPALGPAPGPADDPALGPSRDLAARAPVELVLDCDGALPVDVAADLDHLLRRLGERLHVVVVARVDPAMALHRYRLEGTLTEVRTHDLAFTRSETGDLLAAAGLVLALDDVDLLTRTTQGWAAGLRLASLAIAPRADRSRAVREVRGDTGMVAEYLVAEMLDQQPPEVREVLLRTSVVDVLQPGLAQVLAGAHAPRTLAAMLHANILVEELTEQPGWYTYHPLFRELLRAQLEYEAPDAWRSLHEAAGTWYAEHGCVEDSVRHAVAVRDWTRASETVVDSLAAGELLVARGSVLADLLAGLPRHLTGAEPALVRACLDLRDRTPRAGEQPALDAAPSVAGAASAQAGLTAALVTLASSSLASPPATSGPPSVPTSAATSPARTASSFDAGDVMLSAASTAHALLDALPAERLATHPELRTIVLAGEGTGLLLRGDLDAAARAFAAGASGRCLPGRELPVAACRGRLALLLALRCELRRATDLAAQTVALCGAAGLQGGGAEAAAELALAWASMETFELDAARRHLSRARACGPGAHSVLEALALALVTARLSRAHGDTAGARDALHDAVDREPALPGWAQDLVRREERDAGAEAAAPGPSIEDPSDGVMEPSPSMRVETHLLEAARRLASGDTARARRVVVRCLDLAAPERLRRPFREAPREVRHLLRLDGELLAAHGWLVGGDPKEPTARSGATPAVPVAAAAGAPGAVALGTLPVLVPLTVKELEVLVYLDALARTEDIAGAMFITVNTVRTHIRHILQKLEATRRNEAVRRARELGLIPASRPVGVPRLA